MMVYIVSDELVYAGVSSVQQKLSLMSSAQMPLPRVPQVTDTDEVVCHNCILYQVCID